jgi:hypothetical protein
MEKYEAVKEMNKEHYIRIPRKNYLYTFFKYCSGQSESNVLPGWQYGNGTDDNGVTSSSILIGGKGSTGSANSVSREKLLNIALCRLDV